MNFFKKKTTKSYFKFLKKINLKKDKYFLIKNFGSVAGNQSLYKYFTIFDLIRSTHKLKGDIIEFGIWKGNNLIYIKKILDFLNSKKKVYGFDWFEGLKNFGIKDKKINKKKYIGSEILIKRLIRLQNLAKIEIINDDVKKLDRYLNPQKKFCLVYLDLDLYEATISVLNLIDKYIVKNGVIVFDQALKKEWVGEKKAMQEFYRLYKSKYKIIKLNKNFSPDVILKKLK